MIAIEDIIHFENNYVRSFAAVTERSYGMLFHNRANAASHDSNHALILNLACDLDAAIADVCAFYQAMGISPRFYHGFVPGATEVLLPRLLERGFKMEVFDESYFVRSASSSIVPVEGFEVRRVRSLTPDILDVVGPNDTWTKGVISEQIGREDYHLMVGFVDGQSVAIAELDVGARVSRVDGVVTHRDHRRKGYGRSLLHGLVNHHREVSRTGLYLYSGIPAAIRIYEGVGFRKLDWKPYKWSAWLEQ